MSELSNKKVFVTREHIIPEAIEHLKQFLDVDVWGERSAPPRDVMLQKAQQSDGMITEITDMVDKELLGQAQKAIASKGREAIEKVLRELGRESLIPLLQ